MVRPELQPRDDGREEVIETDAIVAMTEENALDMVAIVAEDAVENSVDVMDNYESFYRACLKYETVREAFIDALEAFEQLNEQQDEALVKLRKKLKDEKNKM